MYFCILLYNARGSVEKTFPLLFVQWYRHVDDIIETIAMIKPRRDSRVEIKYKIHLNKFTILSVTATWENGNYRTATDCQCSNVPPVTAISLVQYIILLIRSTTTEKD